MSKDKPKDESIILDTILEDKSYSNISFSSVEDIKQFLDNFDIIYMEAINNNMDALCLIEDFSKLIYDDNGQPLCEMICQYIQIKSGKKKVLDKNGEEIDCIIQQLATDNGRWARTINKLIDEEIEFIIERNTKKWLESVKKKYDVGKCKYDFDKANEIIDRMSDEEFDKTLRDLDWKIKYGRFEKDSTTDNTPQTSQNYPQELKDLEEAYCMNEDKLSRLRQIEDRNEDEQKELNRRIELGKGLLYDIKYIKGLYNIKHEMTSLQSVNYSDRNALSYDSRMDDLNCVEIGRSLNNKESDDVKVKTIKSVASEVLTDREYKIFAMYYLSNMSQNQIADIIGVSRWTISRNLDDILTKIRKSLKDL